MISWRIPLMPGPKKARGGVEVAAFAAGGAAKEALNMKTRASTVTASAPESLKRKDFIVFNYTAAVQ
jgi:hypothetical protein